MTILFTILYKYLHSLSKLNKNVIKSYYFQGETELDIYLLYDEQ